MFEKRCSLCGGKLRGNICTECGLDNSKSDANYVSSGSTHRLGEGMTHYKRLDRTGKKSSEGKKTGNW